MGLGIWNLEFVKRVVPLIKDRCTLLPDFWTQGHFFFATPEISEKAAIKEKWNEQKQQFFTGWIAELENQAEWTSIPLEANFTELLAAHNLKKGDVLLPLRIMLVGGKYGPGVFAIAEVIGKEETIKRLKQALEQLT